MSVKQTHKSYEKMVKKWQRCRDVAEGQDAMQARCVDSSGSGDKAMVGADAYIPALHEQTTGEYAAYVARAPFYNATWRTIAGLVGMIFRKAPTVEVPASVKPLLINVTREGMPFNVFAQHVVEECLTVGRIGILVDYPAIPLTKEDGSPLTQADVKAFNLRPSMSTYRAESIINWSTTVVMNRVVLSRVVLVEQREVQSEDEWECKMEDVYRVLDLTPVGYRQRLFRVKKEGDTFVDEKIGEDIYPI